MYTKLNKRASWKSQFEETHCHTASGTHLNAKGLAQATVSTVQGLTPTLASAAAAKMERREQMWRPSQRAKTKGCVKWFSQTKANQEVRDLVWFFCVMFRKLNCTENEIVDCRKNLHWRQVDFCFAFFFNQNTKVSFFFQFIYLFLIALGLNCSKQTFSSCGEWNLLSSNGTQISRCSGLSCWRAWAPGTQASVAACRQ